MSRAFILAALLLSCDPGPGESTGGAVGASGSRLKMQYLEGADGSRLPLSLWDMERNEACEPKSDETGTLRCLPVTPSQALAATISSGIFSDPACAKPVMVVGNCATPRYAFDIVAGGGCGDTRYRLYKLLGVPTVRYSKTKETGACEANPLVDGPGIYEFEPVSPSAFVALTRKAL